MKVEVKEVKEVKRNMYYCDDCGKEIKDFEKRYCEACKKHLCPKCAVRTIPRHGIFLCRDCKEIHGRYNPQIESAYNKAKIITKERDKECIDNRERKRLLELSKNEGN